jgi:hypothetical protein
MTTPTKPDVIVYSKHSRWEHSTWVRLGVPIVAGILAVLLFVVH